MIITFTANPSIDVTLDVPTFAIDEVNRAASKIKDPAGKGINVSRALSKNDVPTAAIFPADATNGAWLVKALAELGIATFAADIRDEIRTNITIVDDAGHTTKVNEPGPIVSTEERSRLLAQAEAVLAGKPDWLVMGGSLPRGLDSSFYVALAHAAHANGVRVAIDTSGVALKDVAHAGVADLLKPNHEELEEIAGHSLPTVGDVVDFCHTLLADDHAAILVSLGEHGALLVTRAGSTWAGHAPVVADSTVGAGDSSLAGYLSADFASKTINQTTEESRSLLVATAVAWGSAAVQLPGTTVPGPNDITINKVTTLDSPNPKTRIEEL